MGARIHLTVDWAGQGGPEVGDQVHHHRAGGREGWLRVLGLRVVKHKKPLRPGYHTRYRIHFERLPRQPDDGYKWTLTEWPKGRTPRTLDRFSPLL